MTYVSALPELKSAVPPPIGGPFVSESDFQNLGIRKECGLSVMPDDWKHLIEDYGMGIFDNYIALYAPVGDEETLNFQRMLHETLEIFRDFKPDPSPLPVLVDFYGADEGEEIPYDVGRGTSQLIPWAHSVNGDYFFLNAKARVPDDWSIVVYLRGMGDWEEIESSCTQFLVDALSGRHASLFPDDFPSALIEFNPTSQWRVL